MALEKFLGKKYKIVSSENFEEYLEALGTNMLIRKYANSASPVIELTKTGDEWSFITHTVFKKAIFKFIVGTEFEHETTDLRKAKSLVTIDGTTIHEIQKDSTGKVTSIERIFSEDEVKMIMKIDDVVCTRIFKPEQQRK